MTTIEIICTALGTAVTVVGGVYGVVNYIFKKGMNREHQINFENKTNESLTQISYQIDRQEKETKI